MTVYDYIRLRWPEHAQRIVECAMDQDKRGAEYDLTRNVDEYVRNPNAQDVLGGLFIWAGTKEGHEYWKAVSKQGESVR